MSFSALMIDIFGLAAGLVSMVWIIILRRQIAGRLGKIMNFVIAGILLNILALSDSIIFIRLKLFPDIQGIDIHHLLMILGMISFVFAAKQFSSYIKL